MSQASDIVNLLNDAVHLFHDPEKNAYVQVDHGDHTETYLIKERGFRRYVQRRYFQQSGHVPGSQGLQDALGVIEGMALFNGPTHEVGVRLIEQGGAVYLDLGDPAWSVVEIDGAGWRMSVDPPVFFRRPKGLLELPQPEPGGKLDDLRKFVNLTDDDWILYEAALVAAFRPRGPYTVVNVLGNQGSAKSTATKIFRALIDPNSTPLRAEPHEVRDLVIAARNGWVSAFDNLSRISHWMSDAICRLATGGGFGTRELYSDSDEKLFDAMRPVVINGIGDLAVRGDLLDRSLLLYPPEISDEKRRPEDVFDLEFEAARPRLLGALLDAVSTAIKEIDGVHLDRYPRMADFTKWTVAASSALSFTTEEFLAAYEANRRVGDTVALEADRLADLVIDLVMHSGPWSGTATELLDLLGERAPQEVTRSRDWPRSAIGMGNTVRRIAPALRSKGVEVVFERLARGRIIHLEQVGTQSSQSSQSSQGGAPGLDERDEDPDDNRGDVVTPVSAGQRDDHDDHDDPIPTCSKDEGGRPPAPDNRQSDVRNGFGRVLAYCTECGAGTYWYDPDGRARCPRHKQEVTR